MTAVPRIPDQSNKGKQAQQSHQAPPASTKPQTHDQTGPQAYPKGIPRKITTILHISPLTKKASTQKEPTSSFILLTVTVSFFSPFLLLFSQFLLFFHVYFSHLLLASSSMSLLHAWLNRLSLHQLLRLAILIAEDQRVPVWTFHAQMLPRLNLSILLYPSFFLLVTPFFCPYSFRPVLSGHGREFFLHFDAVCFHEQRQGGHALFSCSRCQLSSQFKPFRWRHHHSSCWPHTCR